jgi:hypothetical protein
MKTKILFVLHSRNSNNITTAYMAESLAELEAKLKERTNISITDLKNIQIITSISEDKKND